MENASYGQLNAEKILGLKEMIDDDLRRPKIEAFIVTKLLRGIWQVDYEDKIYMLINPFKLIELVNQLDKPTIFCENLRSEISLSLPMSLYGIRIIEDEEFAVTILRNRYKKCIE